MDALGKPNPTYNFSTWRNESWPSRVERRFHMLVPRVSSIRWWHVSVKVILNHAVLHSCYFGQNGCLSSLMLLIQAWCQVVRQNSSLHSPSHTNGQISQIPTMANASSLQGAFAGISFTRFCLARKMLALWLKKARTPLRGGKGTHYSIHLGRKNRNKYHKMPWKIIFMSK